MAVAKKKTTATAKKKKTALIVWGGWDGHTPKPCADVFAPWLESKGFRVIVSDTLDIYSNKRRMRHVDLIVPMWTMGAISGEQWGGMRDAIDAGAAVAGFHGGMCDAFRENTGYQFMTGGQWVDHPGGIIKYTVNITDEKDPIVRGIKDFEITSEQYYMHTDPGNEVIATTTFSGKHEGKKWIKGTVMPVVWKRMYNKSRIFYSSLGHVADEFGQVPEALEIAKRGMLWAAKERITPEFKS